jgi:universal stress protein A
MFQILPVDVDNIMAVKASGKLTDEDYQQFLPKLNEFIDSSETPVSLLLELEDFHGWNKKAAWDDFKFGMKNEDDIARIAIVGENRWQKWMTVLGDAFTSTDMRYFPKAELSQAWSWLRSPQEEAVDSGDGEFVLVPYRHILLATDFSEHSSVALKRAVELAKIYKARLSLIHAVESVAYPEDTDFLIAPTYEYLETDQILFDQAQERLREIAKKIDIENVQHEVIWGSPKYAVLSYAEAQNVDLIVAGSHGRHGLARLLGSTASSLVSSASSDVVVVRIPQ